MLTWYKSYAIENEREKGRDAILFEAQAKKEGGKEKQKENQPLLRYSSTVIPVSRLKYRQK